MYLQQELLIMIDPSIRLRRAIYLNSPLLIKRILAAHPHLLRNPDFNPTFTPPSLTSSYTGSAAPIGLSNTSLHLAAYLNHVQIVRVLLALGHENLGISLNEEYQTPLMLAAREGHTEVVLELCKDGIGGIERRDARGRDAIMWAATGGWDTCVQILLTYAPPVPFRPGAYNQQLSQYPLEKEREAYEVETTALSPSPMHYLLNQTDVDGNTALHFAASNGHLLVLRTLLAAGADAEKKNVWAWTPVAYSATVSAEVYFKQLIAEVERRDRMRRDADMERNNKNLRAGDIRMVSADESL